MAEKDVDMTEVAEEMVKDTGHVTLVYRSPWAMDYPLSVTEQIHHASISEQIRAGQGSALDKELSQQYYDFPDGKDDGSAAVGVFDLSEPAEVFEREQKFKSSLVRELSNQVARKKAGDAAKKAGDAAKTASEPPDQNGAGKTASDSKTTQ